MVTVREINDPMELSSLGALWNELLNHTPSATFFHSPDWLQVYCNHFGAGKRLRVLVVHDDADAIGILPLVVRRARRSEPFRVLAYAVDGWADCYGPIGPDPQPVLAAGLHHVRHSRRDWQFIELDGVDSLADDDRTQAAFQFAGIPAIKETTDYCAIVDLTKFASWDAYCRSHGAKWRHSLQQQERRLARAGKVTYVRHRTSPTGTTNARWDLYNDCEAISRASWQHTCREGTMLTKNCDRQFYRDCHRKAAERGAVDMNLLYLDGRPAAFSYGYHFQGCVTSVKTAFDPAVSPNGTGRVLQTRQIADSLARGDCIYDMGSGSMNWKRLWLTDLWPIDRYTHFPRGSVIAQLVRGKRATIRWWRTRRAAAGRDASRPTTAVTPSRPRAQKTRRARSVASSGAG